MTIDRMQDGSERKDCLFAIRRKFPGVGDAQMRFNEAVMLLNWAAKCEDHRRKADLLDLFDRLGGIDLMRDRLARPH